MNLEQVKEHFKYAKEVRGIKETCYKGKDYKIDLKDVYYGEDGDKSVFCLTDTYKTDCILYDADTNQLAEILTYIFERGEEVEVTNEGVLRWDKGKFLTCDFLGNPVVRFSCGSISAFQFIRKLSPQSKLEPKLSELKKVAEENGMSVTVIFN